MNIISNSIVVTHFSDFQQDNMPGAFKQARHSLFPAADIFIKLGNVINLYYAMHSSNFHNSAPEKYQSIFAAAGEQNAPFC